MGRGEEGDQRAFSFSAVNVAAMSATPRGGRKEDALQGEPDER